jgi:hypothetical protein
MGGGGLNILPKKSWNVWNHDNIEKVRRDEAQHAAEQEALQRRQRHVDSESRVEELQRRKRRADEGAASAGAGARHVNFFEAEERRHAERGANEHHEREHKLKEEREARRSFRCLGESADRRGDKQAEPWYVTGTYGLPTPADAVPTAEEAPDAAEAADQRGRRAPAVDDAADPLQDMRRLVEKKRKHTEGKEQASKRKRLDALRQERVAREQAERQRALELMRTKHPGLFERPAAGRAGGSAVAEPDDVGAGHQRGRRHREEEDDGTTRESAALRQHRERMAHRRQQRYFNQGGNHSDTRRERHSGDRRRHGGY